MSGFLPRAPTRDLHVAFKKFRASVITSQNCARSRRKSHRLWSVKVFAKLGSAERRTRPKPGSVLRSESLHPVKGSVFGYLYWTEAQGPDTG
jgi:hypothetical protein